MVLVDEMDLPVYIVSIGNVSAEMRAAAFAAAQRRAGDQSSDGHDVAVAAALGGIGEARRSGAVEDGDRTRQSIGRAKQAGLTPHQVLNRRDRRRVTARLVR